MERLVLSKLRLLRIEIQSGCTACTHVHDSHLLLTYTL